MIGRSVVTFFVSFVGIFGVFGGPATRKAEARSLIQDYGSSSYRCSVLGMLPLGKRMNPPGILGQIIYDKFEVQLAKKPVTGAKMGLPPSFGPDREVTAPTDFCRIAGRIQPEKGSEIRFEVWMPLSGWNGRYMGVGNGGLAGSINYIDMSRVVSTGHATSSTDTGHQAGSDDGSWAKGNPVKQRDYGWRAVHLTALAAKAIIKAYYGKPADKNYFNACSNGGRQGLHEAARFPDDYDGIIASSPASRLSATALSMINAAQAQSEPGAAIKASQVKFIQGEVIRQCDALDGLSDGLVNDPRQCKVDTAKMQCGASSDPQCLSTSQAAATNRIFYGMNFATGEHGGFRPVHGFLPSGAEAGNPIPFLGWEGWITGMGNQKALSQVYPQSLLNDFPAAPFGDQAKFDWAHDATRFRQFMAKDLDAPANMKRFFARGGKLIIWHGWADAAIPAQVTLDMYADILSQSGPKAKQSTRLFMVPGVQHCGGGTGAGNFGQMGAPTPNDKPEDHMGAALQHWVEKGRVPESIIGRMGFSMMSGFANPNVKQRLHCAWPTKAVLTQGADPDKAASYSCKGVN